jgi:hypothetical protein
VYSKGMVKHEFEDSGMTTFVEKPLKTNELIDALQVHHPKKQPKWCKLLTAESAFNDVMIIVCTGVSRGRGIDV